MAVGQRDYTSISIDVPSDAGRYMRMRELTSALWDAFGDTAEGARGYSWCGFYVFDREQDALLLAARQPKPACSPIELGGICGRSWQSQRPVVVDDVRTLPADGYVACDPKDLSEVVVPMIQNGSCWGVLDVDSFDTAAFSKADAMGLLDAAHRAGLCDAPGPFDVEIL